MGAYMYFLNLYNPNWGKQIVTGQEMYHNWRHLVNTILGYAVKDWGELTEKEKEVWNKQADFYEVYK